MTKDREGFNIAAIKLPRIIKLNRGSSDKRRTRTYIKAKRRKETNYG